MVKASSIARLLTWLQSRAGYGVFAAAVRALTTTLEEVAAAQQVVFFAPNDAALAAADVATDGAVWAALDPEQVLLYVAKLPAGALSPTAEPTLRQLVTLSGQRLAVHSSPAGLAVPLLSATGTPQPLKPRCLGDGAWLCLLQYGDDLAPTSYTTLAATWTPTPALPTLLQELQSQPAVGHFAAAAAQAALAVALAQPGLYTVLAPTDAALQALAAALNVPLSSFLASLRPEDFVVPGLAAPPAEEATRYLAVTATGWDVSVSTHGGVGRYNQASVLSRHTLANGALFVLDAVLWHGVGG
jgi:hypothetical protein